MLTALDLTNKKYSRLTGIIKYGKDENGKILWLFKCDCGNFTIKNASDVKCKRIKSCGCLRREVASKNNPSQIKIGDKFGLLTVIKRTKKRIYGKVIWLCRCECGKETELISCNIKKAKSCGCLRRVRNEMVN